MKQSELSNLSVPQLVDLFTKIAVEQFETEKKTAEFAKYKLLAYEIIAVGKELKSRPGDQRRALLPLYDHHNINVQLLAAKYTLAIAPADARRMIEWVAESNWRPYSGNAGMCLLRLDNGELVPK
jgi:hypothetical protein